MSRSAYIVPSRLLLDSPPKDDWDAAVIPADPSQSLLIVKWDNPNHEADFEALPSVLHLGFPWEALPAAAVPLLASFQPDHTTAATTSTSTPVADATPPPAPDSVARALMNTGWPVARQVR